MTISTYSQVQEFKKTHIHCGLEAKLTNDDQHTVILRCAHHSQLITAYIPYRQFCMHPVKCAGYNSCPRNYSCSE